jgi:hypothetical protein
MESEEREDHEELGEELEGDVQRMEERSSDFGADIGEVQRDWDAKEKDSATEGAQQPEDHLVLRDRKQQADTQGQAASEDQGGSTEGVAEEEPPGEGATEAEGVEEAGESGEDGQSA